MSNENVNEYKWKLEVSKLLHLNADIQIATLF